MATSLRVMIILIVAIFLQGCTASYQSPRQIASNLINKQHVISTTDQHYPQKTPENVAIYPSNHAPFLAYRIIGKATVGKTTLFGKTRTPQALQDALQSMAASIGGDAIMIVSQNQDTIHANVITHEKIFF